MKDEIYGATTVTIGENPAANAFLSVVKEDTIDDMLLLYSDAYCTRLSASAGESYVSGL